MLNNSLLNNVFNESKEEIELRTPFHTIASFYYLAFTESIGSYKKCNSITKTSPIADINSLLLSTSHNQQDTMESLYMSKEVVVDGRKVILLNFINITNKPKCSSRTTTLFYKGYRYIISDVYITDSFTKYNKKIYKHIKELLKLVTNNFINDSIHMNFILKSFIANIIYNIAITNNDLDNDLYKYICKTACGNYDEELLNELLYYFKNYQPSELFDECGICYLLEKYSL